jgi:dCTP deaminase
MILCDHHIEAAVTQGRIVIDPLPAPDQYDSSSLNLRVGDDFRVWRPALRAPGARTHIDLDAINLANIIDLTEPLEPRDGVVVIPPGGLVLVPTLEYIHLPLQSRLAARVEGRSKQARLGMTAHVTAPTIHAGFGGKITLEIVNHGPFHLEARVNHSRLCQLIVEEVSEVPRRGGSATFSGQETPLGTKKSQ